MEHRGSDQARRVTRAATENAAARSEVSSHGITWESEDEIDCVDRIEPNSPRASLDSPSSTPKSPRVIRSFEPSRYSTRHIALKFAYLGQHYNGLEFHHNCKTPLPTVEEELWKALNKARLVLPTPNPLLDPEEPNWEGCDYSKCGRTDKGVSAFGQVIGLRVRSNRPLRHAQRSGFHNEDQGSGDKDYTPKLGKLDEVSAETSPSGSEHYSPLHTEASSSEDSPSFHHINDEIPYCQVLNRLLPPDIRMLAWCPNPPPDFSARFSCRERRYKYFFTQPAYAPATNCFNSTHSAVTTDATQRRREGWLDISAMRDAAHKFIGLHDFRNFCKVDPSKQIDNFERRIFHAEIEELDPRRHPVGYISGQAFSEYPNASPRLPQPLDSDAEDGFATPKIYTFNLHGSAFIWHQVRHMVAILFLIGQGLEPPSLVDDLLDIKKTPCKPQYEMADDAPLVLWDCLFPHETQPGKADALDWIYLGDEGEQENAAQGIVKKGWKYGIGGLVDDMWRLWRGRKVDEVLAGTLLNVIVGQGDQGSRERSSAEEGRSQKVFLGGDGAKRVGKYIPVMQKPRMESVEAINAKYAKRKGFEPKQVVDGQG